MYTILCIFFFEEHQIKHLTNNLNLHEPPLVKIPTSKTHSELIWVQKKLYTDVIKNNSNLIIIQYFILLKKIIQNAKQFALSIILILCFRRLIWQCLSKYLKGQIFSLFKINKIKILSCYIYNLLFSLSSSKSIHIIIFKGRISVSLSAQLLEYDFRTNTFIKAFGLFVARQAKILIDVLNFVRARVLWRLMEKVPKKTLIMF